MGFLSTFLIIVAGRIVPTFWISKSFIWRETEKLKTIREMLIAKHVQEKLAVPGIGNNAITKCGETGYEIKIQMSLFQNQKCSCFCSVFSMCVLIHICNDMYSNGCDHISCERISMRETKRKRPKWTAKNVIICFTILWQTWTSW